MHPLPVYKMSTSSSSQQVCVVFLHHATSGWQHEQVKAFVSMSMFALQVFGGQLRCCCGLRWLVGSYFGVATSRCCIMLISFSHTQCMDYVISELLVVILS